MRCFSPVLLFLLTFPPLNYAATTAQLEAARDKALAYLILQQNGDGSFGKQAELRVRTTSEALQTLARYGMAQSYAAKAAKSWLVNRSVQSVDSLAHSIKALVSVGGSPAQLVEKLVMLRDPLQSYSWGPYHRYRRSALDTTLAFEAIGLAGYNDAYGTNTRTAIVQQLRLSDGSWPMNGGTAGSILATAQSLITLSHYRSIYSVDSPINNGLNWLQARQKPDGGFAEDSNAQAGRVFETAQVVKALMLAQSAGNPTAQNSTFQNVLNNALDFLLACQQSGGNWQDGLLPTLLAAQIAPQSQLPDTDGDGIPDSVEIELGSNPAIADSSQFAVGNGEALPGASTAMFAGGAMVQQAFETDLAASGGNGNYAWSLVSGSLPEGMTLNTATGRLSGTPTQVGQFNFVYRATDSEGWSEDVLMQIAIEAPPPVQVPFMPEWMLAVLAVLLFLIGQFHRQRPTTR